MIMSVWVAARILSSSVEYHSARMYNSSIVAGGSKDREMEEGGRRLEAFPEILKDHVHVVKFYLLNGLPEPPRKVPYWTYLHGSK